MLRHLASPPGRPDTPTPQDLAFDAATLARLADSQRIFDATATDLGPFFARGGRWLLWHGLADQDISPRTTLAWRHALRRDQGVARGTPRRGFSSSPDWRSAASAQGGPAALTR